MRILIIGATGTLGKFLLRKFAPDHEVIGASRKDPRFPVDIAEPESIQTLLESTGKLDAIINCAGEAKWNSLEKLSYQDFQFGFKSKLMGQVNLVLAAKDFLSPEVSITLTSGILADRPVPGSSIASMVNGALHSFVLAASNELPDGVRLNVVCPGLVEDSVEKYAGLFPGHVPISMNALFEAYDSVLKGSQKGEVIRVY